MDSMSQRLPKRESRVFALTFNALAFKRRVYSTSSLLRTQPGPNFWNLHHNPNSRQLPLTGKLTNPRSQIDRLKITGIRSFDNTQSQTIQFFAPLTLIVGYNGSGKTTIIECLKYATIGQLPPNSKGGAFVHDPKLCGEKEVMAQVKLSFKGHNDTTKVVTRSLQLIVKKGGARTQNTLEGNLVMKKDGERTSLSKRTAELNKLMPQLLGVSPAVLDYVIFCHQDESLWPMSEPGALKKKFDEIFEAMKYTKAIENLKSLKKNHADELKTLRVHENNFKDNKDKAERLEKASKKLEKELENLRERLATLKVQIEEAMETKQEKHLAATKAYTAVEELNQKTLSRKYIQESVDELKSHIQELQESDEWLEATLAQYDERMAQYEEEEESYRIQYTDLKESAQETRQKISQKQSERGQRQAEKESYEEHLESRIQLVKEAARSHSMRGYDGDLDDDQIREFVERMKKQSRDKDRELDHIRTATDEELEQAQTAITDLKSRQASKKQEKDAARQAIASNEKKLTENQIKMNKIAVDEGTKAALEASLNDIRERLRRITAEYEAANWENNLEIERKRLRELREESTRLRNEALQANKLADSRASLNILQGQLKDREGRLSTMTATYHDRLAAIVSSDWQVNRLEADFQGVVQQRARAVADAKKQLEGVVREENEVTYKLNTARASLKKKKEEMQQCQQVVLRAVKTSDGKPLSDINDYPDEMASIEKERAEIQTQIDGASYADTYFNQCEASVKDQNECKLCLRKFANGGERSTALKKISQLLAKLQKDALLEDFQNLKEDFKKASAVRPQYDTYTALFTKEIPLLETEIQKVQSEKDVFVARLERLDSSVIDAETAEREVEGLSKTVSNIIQYSNDISNFEAEIATLSSQQKFSGSLLSIDEIERQSRTCEDEVHALETKIQKITTDERQAAFAINSAEREKDNVSNKLATALSQLEQKRSLSSAIEELRENNVQLRNTIQLADADLQSLTPQFAKAKAQHEDVQQRGRAKQQEVQVEKDKVAQTVYKFSVVEKAINKYIEEGGPGKLSACERAINTLEQNQKSTDAEISRVTELANKMKARRDEGESTRKSIKENIRYRRNLRELQKVHSEIDELNSRDVIGDHKQLDLEAISAAKRYQNLIAERGPLVGEMTAKDAEFARYLTEWETDYKDAAKNFREAHVKVEATKAAIDDLGKYSKALDAAIMKYHSLKMAEINQIAGDLWQRTYQGTDVDTIMIRSDPETESQKRNYNYRVCMVKQDAELDMRGRCSAGQKVLASIIIRLALAECFGVNCGIIALDEPTTNLDQDNIKALAESLHSIIKARQSQANFQLIIITHDENFLTEMKARDFCETYYRVSRNDKQKSIIERQNLDYLMPN
ncbi:hypothetical protein G7Y89_g3087 [Cudoniella acicularis]|uniref:DNA repair protein RAD50 n=1 Tax=Cudoniella acicularis TaxID=354080 RepID=A0A8H4W8Q8_9HELO|nr:hypothetical protein G7Y89_g3087 [Cudoniella acicularis]